MVLVYYIHDGKCTYGYIRVVSSPDPTHKMGKGLVTLLTFLGCADSAIHTCTNMVLVVSNTHVLVLVVLIQQYTRAGLSCADSAIHSTGLSCADSAIHSTGLSCADSAIHTCTNMVLVVLIQQSYDGSLRKSIGGHSHC